MIPASSRRSGTPFPAREGGRGGRSIATAPHLTEATAFAGLRDAEVELLNALVLAQLLGGTGGGDPAVLEVTAQVLSEVRKAKTEAKQSMKARVDQVAVADNAERLTALESARGDLLATGNIAELTTTESEQASVEVALAPTTD